ncbi:LOW QUALITY PROTEIN: melanization protease 1 [Aedes aegypti]|uniref:CLIP domain-containing serine protease n=1 Tax=Aedes aegypti TaxID=7159 RepID=A0A6I8U7X8_AEDAE|nr:LOW QUALITY PROTEIN: melanization protease 1 [Aedes aegypti]
MTTILNLLISILIIIEFSNCEGIPCTTPTNLTGRCVPLEKCFNLYAVKQLRRSLPVSQENYIRNATCKLDDSTMGVCCSIEKVFELPKECGVSSSSRIAHGNRTEVFEFPFQQRTRGNCGGSLINERYVITAAHCLTKVSRDRSPRKLEFVRLGEHTISTNPDCVNYTEAGGYFEQDCAGPVEDVRVESYMVHSDYNGTFGGDDIGLVRLAESIVFKPHIKPICLPMSVDLKDTLLPQYQVAGWGYTDSLEKSDVLQKALLPRVDQKQCQARFEPYRKKYNIAISEKHICAGSVNLVDACAGDSGGPLMWQADYEGGLPRYTLFGVVSFGVQTCGTMDLEWEPI